MELKADIQRLTEDISAANILVVAITAVFLTLIDGWKKVVAALGFKNAIGGISSVNEIIHLGD